MKPDESGRLLTASASETEGPPADNGLAEAGAPAVCADLKTRADMETRADRKPSEDLETSEDWFLGGALKIQQPQRGYRAGFDAVLLAAAAPTHTVRRGDPSDVRVADVGSGVGTVGLCIAARVPSARLTLIDNDAEIVAIALRNICANQLDERVCAVVQDVAARPLTAGLSPDQFDHAVANPPYFEARAHRTPTNPLKRAARSMPEGGLATWARFLAQIVKPGGTATLIAPAPQLPDLIAACQGRFGGLKVLPVYPKAGLPAGRVLIQGTKGSRGPLTIAPGLVVHGADGAFLPHTKTLCATPAPLIW